MLPPESCSVSCRRPASPGAPAPPGLPHCGGLVLVLLLTAAVALPVQGQSRTRFLHWMYGDAAALVRGVDARVPLLVLGGATLLAPVALLDGQIRREMGEEYRGAFAAYADVTNELGGPSVTPYVGALFLASLATDDARFQEAAFTSMQSLLYAGAVSYGIKLAAGRVRPEDGDDPFRFAPFSGHSSFPSGHTSAAFAILTPWALYYPHPVSYTLLAAGAGGTALSRIARGKHWATDVLAGGGLGFLTAYWLTRQHQGWNAGRPAEGARVLLLPGAGRESVSLTLSMRF